MRKQTLCAEEGSMSYSYGTSRRFSCGDNGVDALFPGISQSLLIVCYLVPVSPVFFVLLPKARKGEAAVGAWAGWGLDRMGRGLGGAWTGWGWACCLSSHNITCVTTGIYYEHVESISKGGG